MTDLQNQVSISINSEIHPLLNKEIIDIPHSCYNICDAHSIGIGISGCIFVFSIVGVLIWYVIYIL